MDPTLRARTVLLSSFMSAMMFGMATIEKGATMDLGLSGLAALALLAGGLLLERALVAAWRRSLGRADAAMAGCLFGLPLSFFFLQNRVAENAGNAPMAQGATRVVFTVGVVLVVVAGLGAWRRRSRQRR